MTGFAPIESSLMKLGRGCRFADGLLIRVISVFEELNRYRFEVGEGFGIKVRGSNNLSLQFHRVDFHIT